MSNKFLTNYKTMRKFEKTPPFGQEGCSANQNAGFQSHDNKQQEDGSHLCSAMRHNADVSLLCYNVCHSTL